MDVTLVPFGNAHFKNGTLQCQHGPEECLANSYEQCAIDAYPDFATHYPFVYCMEKAGEKMTRRAPLCALEAKVSFAPIKACVEDPVKSDALQHKYADLTPKNHQYTPWIVVDKTLSPSDGDELIKEVCSAYKGPAPAGCEAVHRRKEPVRKDYAALDA